METSFDFFAVKELFPRLSVCVVMPSLDFVSLSRLMSCTRFGK